jgi:hypothetical protein
MELDWGWKGIGPKEGNAKSLRSRVGKGRYVRTDGCTNRRMYGRNEYAYVMR